MRQVNLIRFSSTDKGVCGVLSFNGFKCNTLERPWLNNKPMVSCIPVGIYKCVYTYSKKFPQGSFQLLDVPNRGGIRVHSGNYISHIQGCIMLGKKLATLADGRLMITSSKPTVQAFEALFNKKPFELKIVELNHV